MLPFYNKFISNLQGLFPLQHGDGEIRQLLHPYPQHYRSDSGEEPSEKKDKDRRNGKGRRCCLGGQN